MKKSIKNGVLFGIFCSVLCLVSCTCHSSDKKVAEEKVADKNSLTIVANVTVQPEFKDVLLQAFQKVVDGTRKEAGNISYNLYEDTSNPLRFTFVEIWKSQSAIDSHNNSDHFKEFAATVEGKAELEVSILKQKF
jgi:quinol monooxygenase YgiN